MTTHAANSLYPTANTTVRLTYFDCWSSDYSSKEEWAYLDEDFKWHIMGNDGLYVVNHGATCRSWSES